MGRVENKVALVTGAARGQGRSHALKLAEEGADIIAVDVCEQIESVVAPLATEADLAETVSQVEALDRRIVARKADVRDRQALAAAVEEGVSELGRLDIVLANAGIVVGGPALEQTEQQWDEVVDVNLKGAWNTCTIGARHVLDGGRGGAIVITSSIVGMHGSPDTIAYVSAKHGVVGLMRGLAIELGPQMIRVNTVHPSQVDAPMFMNPHTAKVFCPDIENPTREDVAAVSQRMHVLPVPWADPVDISNAILFLVSEEGRYITGVTLPVDCGCDLIN